MEKLDLEAQVWQRIAGQPQPERVDLRPLLLTAWEQASVLRQVQGLLSGRNRERIRELSGKAIRSADAIKGMLALSGQPVGELHPVPLPREPVRRLLEKSYHRSMRLMTEYTARGIDPGFGTVYQGLADREREIGMTLVEILGRLEN